jgi:hypothetical protein
VHAGHASEEAGDPGTHLGGGVFEGGHRHPENVAKNRVPVTGFQKYFTVEQRLRLHSF